MRRASLLVVLIGLGGLAADARAQSQSCSKDAPQVRWTVAQKNSDGSFATFGEQTIGNIINAAECACDSTDLYLVGRVFKAVTAPVTPQVWVGTSCNVITSQPTSCQQVTATVSQGDFFSGSSTSNGPAQQIPVRALVSPKTSQALNAGTVPECPASAAIANSEFILFPFDPSNPDYCVVQLTAKTSLPAPASNLVAASGDGAISLRWESPPFGTADMPVFFQALCADAEGNPVPGHGAFGFNQPSDLPHQLAYSTCIDPARHVIERRFLAPSGNAIDTGGGGRDGGTTTVGFGASALTEEEAVTTTTDGGATPSPSAAAVAALSTLDQKFVVSDPQQVLVTNNKLRVDNAHNGVLYTCVVLAIDNWGNAAPSNFASATPAPVENIYRRFLDEGGQPQGFCFIATAAFGSYQHPYVKILRRFRDQALLPSTMGRAFVAWYYRASPPPAKWIAERPSARFVVRVLLWPVIALAWMHLELLRLQHFALICVVLWLLVRRRRRARARAASGAPPIDPRPAISAGGAA